MAEYNNVLNEDGTGNACVLPQHNAGSLDVALHLTLDPQFTL